MTGKSILYAAVGAGDLALEKARSFDPMKVRETLPRRWDQIQSRVERTSSELMSVGTDFYGTLVERGEKTVRTIRNAAPTKKAVEQAKSARRQTKAAVTSSQKAAQATAQAVKQAAGQL